MKAADEFLIQNELPKSTKIKRIAQGKEPDFFKQYFESWNEATSINQSQVEIVEEPQIQCKEVIKRNAKPSPQIENAVSNLFL